MYLHEVFLSLQGESKESGYPCIFIRLWGCPIGCSYCDQPQKKEDKRRASIETVVNKVRKFKNVKRVCITGGEPLIYMDEVMALVFELSYMDYKVSIETSGCITLDDFPYRRSWRYIMDIKCPSSGVVNKNKYDNLLKLQPNDEVVFVIKDKKDYNFMKDILKKYPTQAEILLSPMFNEKGEYVISKSLVKWVLQDRLNCRVQVQLHKILGFA